MDWHAEISTWRNLKHRVDQFWTLPKLESGKAQVPYLYGPEGHKLLTDYMVQVWLLVTAFFIKEEE